MCRNFIFVFSQCKNAQFIYSLGLGEGDALECGTKLSLSPQKLPLRPKLPTSWGHKRVDAWLISCSACLFETWNQCRPLRQVNQYYLFPKTCWNNGRQLPVYQRKKSWPQANWSNRYWGKGVLCWGVRNNSSSKPPQPGAFWGAQPSSYCLLGGRSSPELCMIRLVSQPEVERNDIYLYIVPVCIHTF